MPDMTGTQLAAEIHARGMRIPFILLTGFGDEMKAQGDPPPEIDLVLELSPGRLAAFEVKRSAPAGAPAGFRNACDDIAAVHRFMVFPGPVSYSMGGGVTALAAIDIASTASALK